MKQNTLTNKNSIQTRRHEKEQKRSKLITNKLSFEEDKILF